MNSVRILFVAIVLFQFLESCTGQKKDNINFERINDSTLCYGTITNNHKEGHWVFWNENSKRTSKIVPFNSGKINGIAYVFNNSGVLIKSMNFENERLNGIVIFYNSKGELIARYKYVNDILESIQYYVLDPESPPRNHDFKPEL